MSRRDQLAGIAAETLAIIEAGRYAGPGGAEVDIAAALDRQARGARLHPAGETLALGDPAPGPNAARVADVDAVGAILGEGDADGEACCLVFASARRPGGGFLTGANAQEESLARASTLHLSLELCPAFYARHRESPDLAYSDAMIHAPGALVLRDPSGRLLPRPVGCAFVVAAAPNLTAIRDRQPTAAARVPGILARRAARVLDVCAAHGHRRLVLGAWGCGVFGNEPRDVARAFAAGLAERPWFDRVTFAIPSAGSAQHAAFRGVFPGG